MWILVIWFYNILKIIWHWKFCVITLLCMIVSGIAAGGIMSIMWIVFLAELYAVCGIILNHPILYFFILYLVDSCFVFRVLLESHLRQCFAECCAWHQLKSSDPGKEKVPEIHGQGFGQARVRHNMCALQHLHCNDVLCCIEHTCNNM